MLTDSATLTKKTMKCFTFLQVMVPPMVGLDLVACMVPSPYPPCPPRQVPKLNCLGTVTVSVFRYLGG